MSWKTVRLGSVAEVAAGGAAPQGSEFFGKEGKPFVRAGSLPILLNGENESALEHLTEAVARLHRLRLFPKNTVLFAKSGMSATKGHIYQLKQPCYVVSHLAAIIPKEDLEADYLRYWLQVFSPSRLIQDAAYPSIRLSEIAEVEIPLPATKDEQKRIAAVLDKADDARRKRGQSIKKLDQFLESVFLDMFGDPVSNPKGFPVCTIRDLISSASYGTSQKAEATGKVPILRMNNITYEGGWSFKDLKYNNLSDKDAQKYLVEKGDLLFNRTNSKELVGKTAVYREDEPIGFAGYLVRVRANREANNEYISAFLNSKYGKKTLFNMCKNIIGMANINAQELQNIRLLKPPKELQDEFARIVEKVEQLKEPQANHLQKLNFLFQSLQQRAFAGELFGAAKSENAAQMF